jgi:hypothetical protein
VLRWLLPVLAVLALLGQAVTAYAAAGVIGESSCCCPSPSKCKCDHDGKSSSTPEMQRCNGEAKLFAVTIVPAIPAPVNELADEPRVSAVPPPPPPPIPDDITRTYEEPPS